jgi:hypothetical protein
LPAVFNTEPATLLTACFFAISGRPLPHGRGSDPSTESRGHGTTVIACIFALSLKFAGGSADPWFMPTEPIIIIIGGGDSFFAWLFGV